MKICLASFIFTWNFEGINLISIQTRILIRSVPMCVYILTKWKNVIWNVFIICKTSTSQKRSPGFGLNILVSQNIQEIWYVPLFYI